MSQAPVGPGPNGAAAGSGSSGSSNPTPLRRNQGATSSASTDPSFQQRRRRIDDSDANWLAAESSTESDTDYSTSDEDGAGDGASHPRALSNQTAAAGHPRRNHHSSASLSSSSTLYDGADRGRVAEDGSGKKPLVSYVTNNWQSKGNGYDEEGHSYHHGSGKGKAYYTSGRRRDPSPTCCDEMMDSPSWWACLGVTWKRTTLRLVGIWALVVLVLQTGRWWIRGPAQHLAQNGNLRQSVRLKLAGERPSGIRGKSRSWFGTQLAPEFQSLQQVASLNDADWRWADGKRMVIVGDVHGCTRPLEALLKKLKFDGDRDHLALVGDLVSKGPDSSGALDLAMSHNASCVRGNHDDRLLLLYRDIQAPLQAIHATGDQPMTGTDIWTRERALARTLREDQIAYLSHCPLILSLGELPSLAPSALLAHAGLIPGLALERQDPVSVMNMRSVDLRTHTPIKVHSPAVARRLRDRIGDDYRELPPPWEGKKNKIKVFDLDERYVLPASQLWEEWQAAQADEADRSLLIYGHDSAVGLVDGPWAVGLDTGCVDGGSLSALVLEMKAGKVSRRIESVECTEQRKEKERKKKEKKKNRKKVEKKQQRERKKLEGRTAEEELVV